MGCEPTASVVSDSVAVPLLRVPVPTDVPLSRKVTEPDEGAGETFAVNVTLTP